MRREVLEELLRDAAAKRAAVLVTDLGSGASRLMHLDADEGVEPEVLAAAREAVRRDESSTLERAGGMLFLTVYNPPVRVVVVGAVHIAQALAPMVQLAGYEVVVVDPRPAFATEERFAGIPLLVERPEEAFAKLGIDRRTAVVAVTHDRDIDDPALAAALRSDAFYVGALGSRKGQAARRERMKALGFTAADLARVHGPVGLDLGAVSPGEIAVSILAPLVGRLRRPGEPAAAVG